MVPPLEKPEGFRIDLAMGLSDARKSGIFDIRPTAAFVAYTVRELSLGDGVTDKVRPELRNSASFPSSNRGG
jgi:hypothetical protein